MNAPTDGTLAAALATLGLRPDADSRSVRRAYAQQVKQIDQATQLQAFQTLREAYELALAVISRQEARARDEEPAATPAPAVVPTPVAEPAQPPTPADSAGFAPPDSGELARAVFQGFAVRADAGFQEEAEATAALQDALADDRLLNLEARTLFELQVAHRIMQGWQPGHEFLFGPACEVFHWERDRAHLRVFGQLGAALDAAINEKLIFFRQSPGDFDLQRNVIRRLRAAEMPSVRLRRADMPLVQMLVQRYPNWLRLITSQANINTWFQDLPEDTAEPAPALATKPSSASESRWKAAPSLTPWFLVMCGIFMLVKLLGGSSTPSYQPPPGLSRPQATVPSGPPISTWPPAPESRQQGGSILDPAKDSPFGSNTTIPAQPLYRDLPPPAPAPAAEPAPAVDQITFLGNVSFTRSGRQVTVDDVEVHSTRGRSTLQPGDRLPGCPTLDQRMSFAMSLQSSACGTVKNVDSKTGVVTYVFRVLRRGQTTTAALALPPPQAPFNAVAVEEALKAAAKAPMPPPALSSVSGPSTEKLVQLGHVKFRSQDSAVVVAQVGERTSHSFGTLQPGDMVLGCMGGSYYPPLIDPSEVRHCVVSNPPPQDGLATPYMFRILRNGRSQSASLTLRSPGEKAAPSAPKSGAER